MAEDKKLTDSDIVKAVEHCQKFNSIEGCENCPYDCEVSCLDSMFGDVLDLINRLQEKVEKQKAKIKAEAYKEFADELKNRVTSLGFWQEDEYVFVTVIDNFLKEWVGE